MEFKEPWRMTYLEYVDAIIEHVKERLGRTHPLSVENIFVAAVSNDPEAALLEIEHGESMEYAVVYYHGKQGQEGDGKHNQPEVVYLKNAQDVQHMIEQHHREWLLKYTEKESS